ncbi:MAG: sulfatase [Pirellulaceae bacterium]
MRRIRLLTIGLTMLCFWVDRSVFAEDRPNVLFLAVDDLNDWIGCYGGHPQAKTPNMDRLAERSVRFTNAHCQAPICNPSRISLLTGVLPSSSGVYYLGPRLRQCEQTKNATTLVQHFANHGYQTLGAGKIFHVEGNGEFQTYAGNFGGFGPRPQVGLNCTHMNPLWDWGPFPERNDQMPDQKLAEWTVQQLKTRHDQPFFLACGFYRPHVPLYAPQEWFDQFPLEQIQLPAHVPNDLNDVPTYGQDLSWSAVAPRHQWMLEHDQWKKAVQAYLACTAFVDAQVGKILDALQQSDYAENTIVILWTDHGFHLGTKERWGKRSLWEVSTKVPLLISAPGMSQGVSCDEPVGLIDLFPTLIDLCDLRQVTGLEGHSLGPQLSNPETVRAWPAITTFGQHNHAIRSKHFRFITYADGTKELYDHREDPHEFKNLANDAQYAHVIREHEAWLPQINQPLAPGSHNADARPGSAADIDGMPHFPAGPRPALWPAETNHP